ncbi:pyrimidine 5'-nucleotidase [Allorhizobium sp. BGMRC 0089]|uniref:pyrimidine 5'-nucleotidase n=1 Tax=Allorhizobium sonneratiae TaxID=2934936 RepID=UPI002033F7D7|nr:pyrimidine 5'-nucleotidase [Allorhizobium sonneratiae]MCM2291547.1 pyrimidine 5'-nucleotidase [Allorhizobium sonneratiae]
MADAKREPDHQDFAHVRDWVFDLDNTLYPHHIDLFSQIDVNMTAYVAALLQMEREEARQLQKRYYHEHGTTLAGLMLHHGVDPHDFLEKAHQIDYALLQPDLDLAAAIAALPGRKFIFTNGTVSHAQAAAAALGILELFDDIFDIVAGHFQPKPLEATYAAFLARHGINPLQAAMFEDLPRNLIVPKALGMVTTLIVPAQFQEVNLEEWERLESFAGQGHVDYVTSDLGGFLGRLTA